MRRVVLALLAAVACSTASPASAVITGNDIYKELCAGGGEGRFACLLYAAGVADSFYFMDLVADGERRSFCIPANVKNTQIRDVFARYLREHPEERHGPAVALAVMAFSEAWPGGQDWQEIDAEPLIEQCWAISESDRDSGVTARMRQGTSETIECLQEEIVRHATAFFKSRNEEEIRQSLWVMGKSYADLYWVMYNEHRGATSDAGRYIMSFTSVAWQGSSKES
jgi:hypothetical protein